METKYERGSECCLFENVADNYNTPGFWIYTNINQEWAHCACMPRLTIVRRVAMPSIVWLG